MARAGRPANVSDYLSTDPDAGRDGGYLSTDPDAGSERGGYLSTDPHAGLTERPDRSSQAGRGAAMGATALLATGAAVPAAVKAAQLAETLADNSRVQQIVGALAPWALPAARGFN